MQAVSLDDLLTPDELSKILAVPLSWVYRKTRRHEIPFVKVGKYLRFQRSMVEQWLTQNREPAIK